METLKKLASETLQGDGAEKQAVSLAGIRTGAKRTLMLAHIRELLSRKPVSAGAKKGFGAYARAAGDVAAYGAPAGAAAYAYKKRKKASDIIDGAIKEAIDASNETLFLDKSADGKALSKGELARLYLLGGAPAVGAIEKERGLPRSGRGLGISAGVGAGIGGALATSGFRGKAKILAALLGAGAGAGLGAGYYGAGRLAVRGKKRGR